MAIILDGKKLRDKKMEELKGKLVSLKEKCGLLVIQVGNDEASNIYVRNKQKLATSLGYDFWHEVYDEKISEDALINAIQDYNNVDNIDGIIVQMPLPKHLDSSKILNSILPSKDVDGLTYINQGRLMQNAMGLVPCTPKGIIDLLEEYNIPISGANVVVIGRSVLVGKPLEMLLINKDATVSLLHSKTNNIAEYTRNADIVIVAVGKKDFLTKDMVKDKAVVIDVGINRDNGKVCGDVKFDEVSTVASYITPVPGGVGPMTVCELMENVYLAHQLRRKK